MTRTLSLLGLLLGVARADAPPPPAAPTVQLVRLDPVFCADPKTSLPCMAGTAFGTDDGVLPAAADGASAPSSREEGIRAKVAAELWVRLLEDTVISWPVKTSPAGMALGKALKATALPDKVFKTGPSTSGSRKALRVQSRPAAPVQWVGAPGSGTLFSQLRWQVPAPSDPTHSPPATAILAGRFAQRMAASGSPVNADLLAGDPTSALAFFQQMFPVSQGAQAGGFPVQALAAFARPPAAEDPWWDCDTDTVHSARIPPVMDGSPVILTSPTLSCLERLAGVHARGFFDDLGLAMLRFGLPGTLPAQLRVLTAANGMVSPPGSWPDLPPIRLDALVVASQGQLDPAALKGFPAPLPGPPGEISLDFSAIPDQVVWREMARQTATAEASATALNTLNARIDTLYAPLTVASPAPLTALDRDSFAAWSVKNGAPGRQSALFAVVGWASLEALFEAMPEGDRVVAERALLLSQVHYQLYATVDPTAWTAPKAQVGAAEKVWAGALADHGVRVTPLAQAGPLLVDPTAVCTLGDGEAALAEKVNGKINVDLYFAVPARETDLRAALWERRADLPFLAVDDPQANLPALVHVLTLPTGAEVVRARWELWTGWHLLWRAAPLSTGSETLSLAVGAACSDLALVPDDLLPALVRWTLRGDPPDPSATDKDLAAQADVRAAVLAPLRAAAPAGGGTVLALADLNYSERHRFPIRLLPKDTLAMRQARLPKGSPQRWLQARGQAVVLSALPAADGVRVAPDLLETPRPPTPPAGTPQKIVDEVAAIKPRYRSSQRAEGWSDAGLAVVTGLAAAGGTGPALDLRYGTASWFASAPRLGWTVGGGAQLLGLPSNSAGTFEFSAPSAEAFVGLRISPLPRLDRKASKGAAWGDVGSDGKRVIGRSQFGLLAVGGAGAGLTDDALYSGWLEPFAAWSLHPPGTARASFQAFFPGLWLGLSARVGVAAAGTSTCSVALSSDLCLWGGLGLRAWALSDVGKTK